MISQLFNIFRKQEVVPEPQYSSEWEKRFEENIWAVDFICPHCDFKMENTKNLWRNNRSPADGMRFNHKCDNCKNPFEMEVSVVVLFKTSKHNYLPTTKKTGFKLIKGGKED